MIITYKKKKFRTTERFWMNICIIGFIWTVFFYGNLMKKQLEAMPRIVTEYQVNTNDTLWSIAKANCPNSLDCREYIEEIAKLNNISNSLIYPNQTILIYQYI